MFKLCMPCRLSFTAAVLGWEQLPSGHSPRRSGVSPSTRDIRELFMTIKTTLLLLIALFPMVATANSHSLVLFPTQHDSHKGRHSNQPLTVLAARELSGATDKWSAYRELYPHAAGYSGVFSFRLPTYSDPEEYGALEVNVNYKGATATRQLWQWQLYDFVNKQWDTIGDNGGAQSWRWSLLSFQVTEDPQRFIRSDGTLLVRLLTDDNIDVSNIDYLSIQARRTTVKASSWWVPDRQDSWQIQLYARSIDELNLDIEADIYVIDLFNYDQNTARSIVRQLHRKGRRVVCYFSAGSYEEWRSDAYKFLANPQVLGNDLSYWPGERWLDIRQLDILGPIMAARLDYLREIGCDGVDPDNVDGYSNQHGFTNPPLTATDQLRYNRWLAQEAHKRGLGIGLKNSLMLIPELVADFDWAINESCYLYSECDRLTPFVSQGKPVLHIEYEYPTQTFCSYTTALGLHSQRKDKKLTAWRESCQ